MNEMLHDARDYGFDVSNNGFNWATIKAKRDAYIVRLNGIYDANLVKVHPLLWLSSAYSSCAISLTCHG